MDSVGGGNNESLLKFKDGESCCQLASDDAACQPACWSLYKSKATSVSAAGINVTLRQNVLNSCRQRTAVLSCAKSLLKVDRVASPATSKWMGAGCDGHIIGPCNLALTKQVNISLVSGLITFYFDSPAMLRQRWDTAMPTGLREGAQERQKLARSLRRPDQRLRTRRAG